MEMTITKALSEIKLLEARLKKQQQNFSFVSFKKHSQDKLFLTSTKADEFNELVKARYQSIKDLIKRRNQIKQAVVISNAKTKLNIANKEYTVAEAIERKSSISIEKELLGKLKQDYTNALKKIEKTNEILENELSVLLETLAGGENKKETNENNLKLIETRRTNESLELVDPLKIENEINILETEIDNFEAEVDQALSISNATTIISIQE